MRTSMRIMVAVGLVVMVARFAIDLLVLAMAVPVGARGDAL